MVLNHLLNGMILQVVSKRFPKVSKSTLPRNCSMLWHMVPPINPSPRGGPTTWWNSSNKKSQEVTFPYKSHHVSMEKWYIYLHGWLIFYVFFGMVNIPFSMDDMGMEWVRTLTNCYQLSSFGVVRFHTGSITDPWLVPEFLGKQGGSQSRSWILSSEITLSKMAEHIWVTGFSFTLLVGCRYFLLYPSKN